MWLKTEIRERNTTMHAMFKMPNGNTPGRTFKEIIQKLNKKFNTGNSNNEYSHVPHAAVDIVLLSTFISTA